LTKKRILSATTRDVISGGLSVANVVFIVIDFKSYETWSDCFNPNATNIYRCLSIASNGFNLVSLGSPYASLSFPKNQPYVLANNLVNVATTFMGYFKEESTHQTFWWAVEKGGALPQVFWATVDEGRLGIITISNIAKNHPIVTGITIAASGTVATYGYRGVYWCIDKSLTHKIGKNITKAKKHIDKGELIKAHSILMNGCIKRNEDDPRAYAELAKVCQKVDDLPEARNYTHLEIQKITDAQSTNKKRNRVKLGTKVLSTNKQNAELRLADINQREAEIIRLFIRREIIAGPVVYYLSTNLTNVLLNDRSELMQASGIALIASSQQIIVPLLSKIDMSFSVSIYHGFDPLLQILSRKLQSTLAERNIDNKIVEKFFEATKHASSATSLLELAYKLYNHNPFVKGSTRGTYRLKHNVPLPDQIGNLIGLVPTAFSLHDQLRNEFDYAPVDNYSYHRSRLFLSHVCRWIPFAIRNRNFPRVAIDWMRHLPIGKQIGLTFGALAAPGLLVAAIGQKRIQRYLTELYNEPKRAKIYSSLQLANNQFSKNHHKDALQTLSTIHDFVTSHKYNNVQTMLDVYKFECILHYQRGDIVSIKALRSQLPAETPSAITNLINGYCNFEEYYQGTIDSPRMYSSEQEYVAFRLNLLTQMIRQFENVLSANLSDKHIESFVSQFKLERGYIQLRIGNLSRAIKDIDFFAKKNPREMLNTKQQLSQEKYEYIRPNSVTYLKQQDCNAAITDNSSESNLLKSYTKVKDLQLFHEKNKAKLKRLVSEHKNSTLDNKVEPKRNSLFSYKVDTKYHSTNDEAEQLIMDAIESLPF